MPPAKITLDHIAIQTSHFDAAIDFYVGILGATLLSRGRFKKREAAWLQIGDGEDAVKLELFSRRDGETLAPWSDFTSGPVHLALRVPDLAAFLNEALEKGATYHSSHPAPFTPPVTGARPIAYLLGPDGEEVEIRD